MILRIGKKDLPRLVHLGEKFYAMSEALRGFNPDVFQANWTRLLDAGIGAIFAAERGENIVAALGGVIVPDINSLAKKAGELFWFADPKYRGLGGFLFRAFEGWARENGCNVISMVHLVDVMPDALDEFYRAMGYKPVEVNYEKEI